MGLESDDTGVDQPGLWIDAPDPYDVLRASKGGKAAQSLAAQYAAQNNEALRRLRAQADQIEARYQSLGGGIKGDKYFLPAKQDAKSTSDSLFGGGAGGSSRQYDEFFLPTSERKIFEQIAELEKNQTLLAKQDADAAFGGVANTARSYLDTENDKTAEVKRQFIDFLERAKGLYSLQDSEQAYAMRAEDQNIATQKAIRKGDVDMGQTHMFGTSRAGDRLSEILRPSLPSFVYPDYKLNRAVGIDDEEGFEDEDYGLPRFAAGTTLPGPRLDPEIAWMIGIPDIPLPNAKSVPVPASWQRGG